MPLIVDPLTQTGIANVMKKILVIEDNLSVRENIIDILELAGYKVKSAANGREGVDRAETFIPDLVLCDIMMPEMDGYDVLKEMRKNNKMAGTPFIFLSALSEKNEVRRGMNFGADDYVTKPFEDKELIGAIESRLKRSEFLKKEFLKNHTGITSFLKEASQYVKLESLIENRDLEEFKANEIIFREGMTALKFYFIHSGSVKTFKTSREGKEFITGIYGPGEFFGQISLLNKKGHYLDTASALKNAMVVSISKSNFNTLLHSNNEVSNKFIDIISNNLIEVQEQLLNMAYAPVRRRAAKALLELYDKGIVNDTENRAISIPREDFAGIIGTATETAIRTLSEFKEEGIINMDFSRRIIVLDRDELVYIADSE